MAYLKLIYLNLKKLEVHKLVKNFFKYHPIHKKIVKYFDILFIFRPIMFFAIWLMIVIGMYIGSIEIKSYPQWIVTFDFKTLIFFLGISMISGGSLIKNQIDDLDIDNFNKKIFILNNSYIKDVSIKCYKISIIFGFLLLVLTNIYNLIIGILIFLFWDLVYNHEKFGWKRRPVLGPFCNLIVGFLFLLSGWIYIHANESYFFISKSIVRSNFFISIIPYLLSYLSVVLLTDIPDVEGDKKYNKITFVIKYSKFVTVFISLVLVILAFFIGFYLNDPLATTSTICSIPFFIYALIRCQKKDILRAIRYPIFILNFFTLTIYPILFIMCGIVFYLSKYYYWHRFELHYPTFLVEND